MVTEEKLVFYVNGIKITEKFANTEPDETLLEYLRRNLNLCGTKLACGEGGCGACTVMVSDFKGGKVNNYSVNACIAPLASVNNCAVTTVEGIGAKKGDLQAIQNEMINTDGSQCGFCTPGMIMTMYTVIRNYKKVTNKQLHQALQGNLCRCTGYRPIWQAFKNTKTLCALGEKCCRNNPEEPPEKMHSDGSKFKPVSDSQEPIFPPALRVDPTDTSYVFKGNDITWYAPSSLEELAKLKSDFPDAKLITGNTECRLEQKFRKIEYAKQIYTRGIKEICQINVTDDFIEIGSAVTINEIKDFMEKRFENKAKSSLEHAVLQMANWFAGDQIRNVASIGGNIMTSSPISDLNQVWLALKCDLEFCKMDGDKLVTSCHNMADGFFTGYRRNIVQPSQFITKLKIPLMKPNAFVASYKVSKRADDDIAIVNGAIYLEVENGGKIKDFRASFGGMAPTTKSFTFASKVIGQEWNDATLEKIQLLISQEFKLPDNVPGGFAKYRSAMPNSFLIKFFFESRSALLGHQVKELEDFNDDHDDADYEFSHDHPFADEAKTNVVGKNHAQNSAHLHVTGQSKYFDDIPFAVNEGFFAPILSQKPHAKIVSIDYTAALALEGVIGSVDANDIQGTNEMMQMWQKEHCDRAFATDKVTSTGQIIAGIVGISKRIAQKAASLVKIEYETIEPVIITVSDAIKHNSKFDKTFKIENGDVEKGFEQADHVLDGTFTIGGQEQFYFETQGSRVVPMDNSSEIDVTSSTQWQSQLQKDLAVVLGVAQNKVHVRTKRIGGGFGGKETAGHVGAACCAVAAVKFNRPVRIALERDEDMIHTGTRHPSQFKYKIGFNKEGKVISYKTDIYLNVGFAQDLSIGVCYRHVVTSFNCYNFENIKVVGNMMITNTPSNTAFRGFGGPQGMMMAEHIMQRVANFLNVPNEIVRRKNMMKAGDIVPLGSINLEKEPHRCESPYNLTQMWDQIMESSDYANRRANVTKFNTEHKFKKRGLAVVPTAFSLGYECKHMNFGYAYVLIYTDGSVNVHHGGIEMGQGLHTKMLQIAAEELGVPIEMVHTSETTTDAIGNAQATSASFSADLNGPAVMEACQKLRKRLDFIKDVYGHVPWKTLIEKAHYHRVQLTATGHYRSRVLDFDAAAGTGRQFSYCTYGIAVSEIELDTLTGQHKLLETEILMDVGRSLNPRIDIGQIEGAFTQGMGLYTSEEIIGNTTGKRWTVGPATYKIPGFGEMAKKFTVQFYRDGSIHHPERIYGSKAIGEPPLFLGSSVYYAIVDAIHQVRQEKKFPNDMVPKVGMNAPLTCVRIFNALNDEAENEKEAAYILYQN